MDDADFLNLLI